MRWLSRLFRILLFTPLAWGIYKIVFNQLGAEPALELNHNAGDFALYFLMLNMLVGLCIALVKPFPTPLRFLLRERRFLGLVSFFYVCLHLFFYLATEAFAAKGYWQIATKTYLTLGFCAFLILLMMALTSNNWSVRRLGAIRWRKFHAWVYLAMILITVHIALIEKANLIFFGCLLVPYNLLQAYRWWKVFRQRRQQPIAR